MGSGQWNERLKSVENDEVESQQHTLNNMLERAEEYFDERCRKMSENAAGIKQDLTNKELQQLNQMHSEQESLSWYIMQREAVLAHLKEQKAGKEMRFEEMKEATHDLMNSDAD